MIWNYRVFLEADGGYVIREVFYERDGTILGCAEVPVEPSGESLEELAQNIEWLKEALQMPVLTLADVPCLKKHDGGDRSENISHEQLVAELGLNQFHEARRPTSG